MVFTECKQPLAGADTSLSTTMGPDTSEEPTYKKPVSGTLHSTSNATPSGEAGVPGQRLALTSLGSMPSPHSGWERQKIGGGAQCLPSAYPSQARGRQPMSQDHLLVQDPLTVFSLQVCAQTPAGLVWQPKLTFILIEEGGKAEDEAHRGLGNCFSDLS